jgi:hypothetical protein
MNFDAELLPFATGMCTCNACAIDLNSMTSQGQRHEPKNMYKSSLSEGVKMFVKEIVGRFAPGFGASPFLVF